jgi:ankyrin repeat protein
MDSLEALFDLLVGERSPVADPTPATADELDTIERAAEAVLPPSLAALLAYDISWMRHNCYGFDETGRFRTQGISELAAEHFAGAGFAPAVDPWFPAQAIALDGGNGDETLNILYFGDADDRGEYPVLELSSANGFTIDVAHATFAGWLGKQLELEPGRREAKERAAARIRILGADQPFDVIVRSGLPEPVAPKRPLQKRLTDKQLVKAIETCAANERAERLVEHVAEAKRRNLGNAPLDAALVSAALQGAVDAMRILLDAGASPDAEDALYWAVRTSLQDVERVRLLLDRGARLTGAPRLIRVAQFQPCAAQLIDLLCAHGADVTAPENGKHQLHHAVYGARVPPASIIDVLLDRGAPHVADEAGCYPLHYAAFFGRGEQVTRLLRRGIDVNLRTANGQATVFSTAHQTALGIAQKKKLEPIVELLVAAGADPAQTDA